MKSKRDLPIGLIIPLILLAVVIYLGWTYRSDLGPRYLVSDEIVLFKGSVLSGRQSADRIVANKVAAPGKDGPAEFVTTVKLSDGSVYSATSTWACTPGKDASLGARVFNDDTLQPLFVSCSPW